MAEQDDDRSIDQAAEWAKRYDAGDEAPKELFRQVSHVAILLSYDLIDKLRYFEAETLKLDDQGVEKRLEHMSSFIEKLKTAYVEFAEVDL